ncbi:MAG: LUD domain-containing protein [Candidatus Aminicenantes bacterium]|nr:MAG: LUD domain-containing protein [Candidatus Aminicenantes bacterium]
MFLRTRQKKRAKKALADKTLQTALHRASSQHFQKFAATAKDIPWEQIKEKAKAIREDCIKRLPELIQQFTREAQKVGTQVYRAETPSEALSAIEKILQEKKAKNIVKSKSMVSEEINLNHFLEKKGYRIVETDLGEWIIQLAGERPSHITAPALHKTKEEVAKLLSERLQLEVLPDPKEIVKLARKQLRKEFIQADVGISGANLAVAESGTLVIVSNEGNARLVTSLPPVHIAVVTAEKFVETLEQATSLVKALVSASSGLKLTAYVSFITGTSRTTDIEKQLVIGVHGPEELHVIILDNGRLEASKDQDLDKILSCLKCGGCMLICPIFQSLGGHVYGGPVYPGGVGLLLTALTHSIKKSAEGWDFCSDCKKCEEFCPVGLPTGELLLKLKGKRGPKLWEWVLSSILRIKSIADPGIKLLSILQKPWHKDGSLKNLPFSWAKGKSLPALNPVKHPVREDKNEGKKVYFFEGCLASLFFPGIRKAVFTSLSQLGYQVVSPKDRVCCGAPSLHLGHEKDVKKLAKKNLSSFANENPDYIITICPTGNAILTKTYPRFFPESETQTWVEKVYDFTEFVVKMGLIPDGRLAQKTKDVFYHYPCHYVNDLGLREEPLKLLRSIGYNPVVEEEPFACCGFSGIFSFKNPDLAAHLWRKKEIKIKSQEMTTIVTDCPGCLFQFKACLGKLEDPYEVFHTAELFARYLLAEKSRNLHPAHR